MITFFAFLLLLILLAIIEMIYDFCCNKMEEYEEISI